MEYKNCGKEVSHNGIELSKVDILGNVCGEFVEFTVCYEYKNCGAKDVKGVYTFPIPEGAIISGFEVNIGGRVIKGKVEDKREIEKHYINLVQDGEYKLSLEELDNDILKMSKGNILKDEKVIIKISYIEELSYEKSKLKLVIPKVVLPYEAESNLNSEDKEYDLFLNLLVETFEDTEFICNTHSIHLEEGKNNLYKITLKGKNQRLNENMIIYLKEDVKETCGLVYENYEEDNGIIYLRFLPDIEADVEEEKKNYLFLIDISESMAGNKIKEAKAALQLCLRNLSEGDTFNIIAMGDRLKYFSSQRKIVLDEETLKEATEWIEELSCEEDALIFEGIKYALSEEDRNIETNIILFTDDIVDDEKEILDYVEEKCNESRIFPFGIDASVNTYFINRIARLTYGKAEFINTKVRIEDVVLRQFNRIKGLQLTDISIDFGTMDVEKTYPRTIEYMYDEEPFSIFARVNGNLEGIVTLEGKVGNRRMQRRIALTKVDLTENANLVEKVWYKKRIESLQNRIIYERGEVKEAMRDKIIQLSTESGLISDETSFMLIEEIYEPVLGVVVRNFLPVKINNEDASSDNKQYYSDNLQELDDIEAEKIDREEVLRKIAMKQLVSGAYGVTEESFEEKLINTARAILVFTKSAKSLEIYKNFMLKGVNYIIDKWKTVSDDLVVLGTVYIALKSYEDRINLKDNRKATFTSTINEIYEILEDNNIEIDELESKIISDIEEEQYKNQFNKLIYSAVK